MPSDKSQTGLPIPVLLMVRELDQGGTERQLTEIAKALDRSRFQPHVGCFRPEGMRGEELRRAGVPVVQFPLRSYRSWRLVTDVRQMLSYVREHDIRVVHTFDYPVLPFGVAGGWLSRKPVLISSQRGHRDLVPPGYRRLLRASDRIVDGIVANCEFIRHHLIEDEKVPERLIQLCYNGIDLEVFRPGPVEMPSPLEEASVVIGVACSLREEKDLGTLLRAFARIVEQRTDSKLAVVGSGPESDNLQGLAASLGIAGNVVFIPATPDVARWLRAMDIFVLPSRSEALSNSLMEAMACGCCAVASRVGGNPELIVHGETGLLFDCGDVAALAGALLLLIDQPEMRRRLAGSGMGSIRERFSVAVSARRMGEIYLTLLKRKAGTGI